MSARNLILTWAAHIIIGWAIIAAVVYAITLVLT